ncbi:MAG: class E sortase, partial [Actinobacteria bacterium]|nr:class E sortase [Actinomycetota bacterium]
KKGPGHYPDTAMPGHRGNAAIAGHRTTYGAPFYDVDELEPGDPIFVTTTSGRFRYEVRELLVVEPDAGWVLDPTEDDRLTLTTCHPHFSAAQRLIVVAGLVSAPVQAVAEQPAPTAGSQPPVQSPIRALDAAGLSGESAARTPAVAWGAAAGAVWLASWFIGRRGHKWVAYTLGLPFFIGALYFCYENV